MLTLTAVWSRLAIVDEIVVQSLLVQPLERALRTQRRGNRNFIPRHEREKLLDVVLIFAD